VKNPIFLGLDRGVWKYSLQTICAKAKEIQLDGLEIQPEHPEIFKMFPEIKNLKTLLKDYEIKRISVHAPIKDINTSSYNPRIREASLVELKNTIQFASQLSDDIMYIVVHGGQNSFKSASDFEKDYLTKALDFTIEGLKKLQENCEEYGILLSIENMTFSPWRLTSRIMFLEQIFKEIPTLRFTFDFHHGTYGSERYSLRILEKFKPRLISVHIGQLFELIKLQDYIKNLNPFVVIEPHHFANEADIFSQLKVMINEIRSLA
jgi:sugar phosphate isomerase/epimerase